MGNIQRDSKHELSEGANREENKKTIYSGKIFTFRVVAFAWAGFILGVIAGIFIFNHIALYGFGAPLFSGIILSSLCGVLGVKFQKKSSSNSSSVSRKVLDVVAIIFMIIAAVVVLFFGLLANADWGVIFS